MSRLLYSRRTARTKLNTWAESVRKDNWVIYIFLLFFCVLSVVVFCLFFFTIGQAAVESGTKDWRKAVHNQTMSSIQVYSGPRSHQDTPSILMLFMREQPQLSEHIYVKMVRAAWRHSSLQALHLCIEARLSAVATSAVHKLHKEGFPAGILPPTPPLVCQRTGLHWHDDD